MSRAFITVLTSFFLLATLACESRYSAENPADLILMNGDVYTMVDSHPWASAVVIKGNTITAVLDDDAAVDAYRGPDTEVIDLDGGVYTLSARRQGKGPDEAVDGESGRTTLRVEG